jgi:4-amino-4-deoxy-L-arabinose transferase-like glycosyltransferase
VTLLRSRDADLVGTKDRSSTRRLLLGLGVFVVAARTTYVLQPLRSDEGGYLLVARQWHTGGEFLYGDYHVDRPPLLMGIFRVAALTDWDPMIRVLAIPFAVLLVVSAWHAGRLLTGQAGGRWAAIATAGLACSPALAADQSDGELFAAPLVLGGIAVGLAAWRAQEERPRILLAVAAGLLAGAAPLVKQNFLEGLVFLGVLVLATVRRQRRLDRRSGGIALGVVGGALLPHAVVLFWSAAAGVDLGGVWQDLVGFRADALGVIWSNSPQASVARAARMVLLATASGVLVAVIGWFVHARPWRLRGTPEEWAVTACLVFGVFSVAGGGSYWLHYLIELVPAVATAVALVAPRATGAGAWMRLAARVVVAAAVAATVGMALVYRVVPGVWFQQRTGEWVAASSLPGDTAFVAYGNASILESADVASPYPYLWSLPMRTLDPDLARLRATLSGPRAPTWIVQVNGLDSWDIDRGDRLRARVEEGYRVVGEVCGNPVWLRADLRRNLAPYPLC